MIKIDKKYLPSKKFMMAISMAVAIIIIAIIINYWQSNTTKYTNNVVLASATGTISAFVNLDSDNDGLPDWKENLYGTDPKKADTDGDGTNDPEEIAINRDPVKANTAPYGKEPNDKIDPTIIEKNQKTMAEYESLSTTDKMARNLMSNLFASQPANGQPLDQSTIDAIVQKSIQDLPIKEYIGITKESDLNIIPVDPKIFSNDLEIYKKNYFTETESFRKIMGQDLNIIDTFISSGKDVKKSMAEITSKYQSIINSLIKTPIPTVPGSNGVTYHLIIINDLEKLIKIDNNIINSDIKNIASVFPDLSMYNYVSDDILTALQITDNVLKINR